MQCQVETVPTRDCRVEDHLHIVIKWTRGDDGETV